MTKVTDLRPGLDMWRTLPQCDMRVEEMWSPESQFATTYRQNKAKKTGKDLSKCQKQARFEIDGRKLCAQHAGMKAIEILMREQNGKA